ncbi:GGDEF domain-containing protein [Paenibacillus sp. 1001270B_150601_E10]|uniref:GGDEF domain-containing protein n=1 Tax=Paenibacillus sp. 1001270B_150601_E10 TaxID=2787079 RepID=UPI00189F3FBD|nr:GGDEF domain-containing protein [Paenibacillus sp. 1001270B_150601_E10]
MERHHHKETSQRNFFTDQESTQIYRSLMDTSMLAIVCSNGKVKKTNHAFETAFYASGISCERSLHIDHLLDEYAPQDFFSFVKEMVKKELKWSGQLRLKNAKQQSFHAFMHISGLRHSDDYLVQVFPWEQINEYERLRIMAYTDELTAIPNFRYFQEQMVQLLQHKPENAFSLLFIDIDHFKSLNDRYGHVVGDKLLKACSYRLMKGAYPLGEVFRKSGDEFLILIHKQSYVSEIIRELTEADVNQYWL